MYQYIFARPYLYMIIFFFAIAMYIVGFHGMITSNKSGGRTDAS